MLSIILWLAAYWFWQHGAQVRMPVAAAPSPIATPAPLTAAEFEARLTKTIADDSNVSVVLEDVLGEGAGAWDPLPRYQESPVNCIIWLQKVLADAYATIPMDRALAMDRLRYFGGVVSFGTRKHYTEHFLNLEPGPLKPADLSVCGKPSHRRVRLEPGVFLKSKNYDCPLFKQSAVDFDISYLKDKDLKDCVPKLAGRGHLVMFAVPSAAYERTYLKDSGPMGLVHAMFLQLPAAGQPQSAKAQNALVYHASTAAGHVLIEQLSSFLERMRKLHLGYALYELDPAWDFRASPALARDPAAKAELEHIAACEKNLKTDHSPADHL